MSNRLNPFQATVEKHSSVLWEELFPHLFVFVLCFSVATHPRGCDITGDDRDLVQWHVHPSGEVRGTGGWAGLTHTRPVQEPEPMA